MLIFGLFSLARVMDFGTDEENQPQSGEIRKHDDLERG